MMGNTSKPFTQYVNHTCDVIYDVAFDVYEQSPFFCGYAYETEGISEALVLLKDTNVFDLVSKEIALDWQDARILAESTSTCPKVFRIQ